MDLISLVQSVLTLLAIVIPSALKFYDRRDLSQTAKELGAGGWLSLLLLGGVTTALWAPTAEDGCYLYRNNLVNTECPLGYQPGLFTGDCTTSIPLALSGPTHVPGHVESGRPVDCNNRLGGDMFGTTMLISLPAQDPTFLGGLGLSNYRRVDITPDLISIALSFIVVKLWKRMEGGVE